MGCIQSKSIPFERHDPERRDECGRSVDEKRSSDADVKPHAKPCTEIRLSKHVKLWNQYLLLRYLGSGVSGHVYLCMDVSTQELVAVKCVQGSRCIPREARSLLSLGSVRNVSKIREILYDDVSSKYLMVMQYYAGGPVFDRNQLNLCHPVPEDVARMYIRDIARGIMSLHTHGIIHGDIKLENALMSWDGSIGLIDLGSSKNFIDDDIILTRKGGTPAFQSPEILLEKGPYSGKAADMYALGTCLYMLLFSRSPHEADGVADLLQKVKMGTLTIPAQPQTSEDAVSILMGLLEKNPQKRTTMLEFSKHTWVTDNGRLEPVTIEQTDDVKSQSTLDPTQFKYTHTYNMHEVSTFSRGDYICTQGELGNGCIGIVIEGTCDILSRGILTEEVLLPNKSVNALSSDDWIHVASSGNSDGNLLGSNDSSRNESRSSSSSSIFDAYKDETNRQLVHSLEREIATASDRLESLRFRSTLKNRQEEYLVEKNATLVGETVLYSSVGSPTLTLSMPSAAVGVTTPRHHAYSAVASSRHTKVLWIPSESFHTSMSSDAALHRTVSQTYCRRQSVLDTILGLCLIRDLIL